MREQLEGSQAIARAVGRCRPDVVPAYPITPQTHIVEALGTMTRDGRLPGARFMTVESEFSTLSAALGASAAGSRAYTATASQGLLYMAEVLFSVAGLGFPVVMTVANRAIGAPINIWNDQSDSMALRDSGWVQLHAADNQEAVDLHPLAFRLAEEVSVPVMVCVDGFVLTHAVEPVEVPGQEEVDAFLPAYRPTQWLYPADPVTIGAMVGPDAFTEVRALADRTLRSALPAYQRVTREYAAVVGRSLQPTTVWGSAGAPTVVVTVGSVTGTVRVALEGRDDVAVLQLGMYRPFPRDLVRAALVGRERVLVVERALSPGTAGPVTADVSEALAGTDVVVHTAVAGLGGRAVRGEAVVDALTAIAGTSAPTTRFLDLRDDVVDRELHRLVHRRSEVVRREHVVVAPEVWS